MTKQVYILLMVFAGFFLMPTFAYACGQSEHKVESACCQNENSHSNNDTCCSNHHSNHQGQDNGCGSTCNHSGCHCVHCNVIPCAAMVTGSVSYVKKQLTFRNKVFLSSEFLSIWIPPKIG